MANKSTKAVANRRTNQTIRMLIDGYCRADIILFGKDRWGVGAAMADKYIRKANNALAESSKFEREEQIGLAIERLNKLYLKAMGIDDYKTALAVQKALQSLLGLEAPRRTEITGAGGSAIELTWQQLISRGEQDDNSS